MRPSLRSGGRRAPWGIVNSTRMFGEGASHTHSQAPASLMALWGVRATRGRWQRGTSPRTFAHTCVSSLCFQEDQSCQDRSSEEKVQAELAWACRCPQRWDCSPRDRRSGLAGRLHKHVRAHCKHTRNLRRFSPGTAATSASQPPFTPQLLVCIHPLAACGLDTRHSSGRRDGVTRGSGANAERHRSDKPVLIPA